LQKKALIQPFCPHIAFTTSDMNETMAMIQEKGFEIVKGPMNIPDEVSWVFIKDYDNNVVEFVEWIGEKR
jgi:predicted enzyme related to lactoylglutathione lyase